MIKHILNKLNKEVAGVHSAAYLLAAFALLSVLLALVRDKLLAYTFGAGVELDIYYAAFRTPDLIYALVASMMSVFVLVPFLSSKKDDQERHALIHTLILVFALLLISISLVTYIFTPYIVNFLFPNIVVGGYAVELINLTRILLLQPILLGISGIFSSVVQYNGRYFIYALTALAYNMGIILGILFLVPKFGIYGLGIGVVFGALLHLLLQVPTMISMGYAKSYDLAGLKEVYKVITTSIPRTLALSANHITLFVLVAMASRLPVGSIAVFTLAFNLQAAPLSIIGASYSTAAFPTLAKLYAQNEIKKFLIQIMSAARHIIFWSLPLMALVVVLRAHIVRVIYGSGAFDWSDTRLTAAALAMFILSLASQGIVLLFIRGYYAASKTYKPLIFSILNTILTMILAGIFIKIYYSSGVIRFLLESVTRTTEIEATAILVLPLAYTIASIMTAFAIVITFAIDFKALYIIKALLQTLLQSILGALSVGLTSYLLLSLLSSYINMYTAINIFLQAFIAGSVGIMIGVIVLKLIRNKEIDTVWKVMHRKFWSRKVVSETEIN